MSDTEEYLDDLLKSLSDEENTDAEPESDELMPDIFGDEDHADILEEKTDTDSTDITSGPENDISEEDDFLKQFEDSLSSDADEDFLRNFELELDEDETEPLDPSVESNQVFLDNIDGIVDGAQKEMGQPQEDSMNEKAPLETESQMEDLSETVESLDDSLSGALAEDQKEVEPEHTTGTSPSDTFASITGEESDEELMSLLSGMTDDADQESQSESQSSSEELNNESDDGMFGLDGFDSLGTGTFDDESEDEIPELKEEVKEKESNSDKNEKKEAKGGILQKISHMLFGEDEDENEGLSEEEAQQLKELEAAKAAEAEEKKAKKKKDKEEKKAQKKKDKEDKKALLAEKKANKPKKEKVPKVKDNTPPLPKKPVILMVIMSASIFLLIMLGSNAIGYSVAKSEAKEAYNAGDYVTAYTKLAGHKIKEKDQEFYTQAGILATVQEEYNAYQSLMSLNKYEMALDCLIRGVGRYNKNAEDATEFGIAPEFADLNNQITEELKNTFGVDADQAQEIYSMRKRKDYTVELRTILNGLGME